MIQKYYRLLLNVATLTLFSIKCFSCFSNRASINSTRLNFAFSAGFSNFHVPLLCKTTFLPSSVIASISENDNENKINSWNGTLDDGNYISSGVYLITASHPDYKSRIGKLAVIM